jgi:deoxyribodipyrimidine photo-lyase
MFATSYEEIIKQIDTIDPIKYGQTRNYLKGKVTYLSPYISRGVISTKQILERIISKGYKLYEIESFVKELLWRDYFQRVWQHLGDQIFTDINNQQRPVVSRHIPTNLLHANTGIEGIDTSIKSLYETGYVHNHCRMYTAMLTTNLAHTHWLEPANWYYYHLLDGDLASNHLSWQWVCGAFSSKKYIANQENINKYCGTTQLDTFLDKSYAEIEKSNFTNLFLEREEALSLKTTLPKSCDLCEIEKGQTTLIYNYYNLDPLWHVGENVQRILLLEPSIFEKHPISQYCMDFVISLSKNIPNIKIYTGEFSELYTNMQPSQIIYKEHPLNNHYFGKVESRDWLCPDFSGYFPSFFGYWKQIEPKIKTQFMEKF